MTPRLRTRAGLALVCLALAGCGGIEPTPAGELVPVADRADAPDLAGPLLDGGDLDPGSIDGQVVVVNFWASWCPPCRVEMPEFQQVADEYEDVAFLGVVVRDDAQLAQAFVVEQGIGYPSIDDPDGELATAFAAFPVRTTPSTVLVDADGRVAAVYPGAVSADDLEHALDLLATE